MHCAPTKTRHNNLMASTATWAGSIQTGQSATEKTKYKNYSTLCQKSISFYLKNLKSSFLSNIVAVNLFKI